MRFLGFTAVLLFLLSCGSRELPVLNDPQDETKVSAIASFTFTDQDSNRITDKTFDDKLYVTDFIFLSCVAICPKMNTEMLKVYKAFEANDKVLFLSHTIDPEHDSIPLLKKFSDNLGISSAKWHFVTGHVDSIYTIAEKSYFTSAYPDSADKSSFIHGGGLLLVDKYKHIRGVYDGTNPAETERLVKDIKLLLKEQF